MENSAATKKPLANTSARTAQRRHRMAVITSLACVNGLPPESPLPHYQFRDNALGFSIAEEMRVDEAVDGGLAGTFDRLELNPHADAAIAPRDASLGVDVALRSRQAKADPDLRACLERARRPDGDAPVPQVERQRGRDRVAESVLNRNPENDPRAVAAVEVVGK